MKQVKCCECGRTQTLDSFPKGNKSPSLYEQRRLRWFFVRATKSVVCGGSHRGDGLDDGKDWCLHRHFDKHKLNERGLDPRDPDAQIEVFLPALTAHVPPEVVPFLHEPPPPPPEPEPEVESESESSETEEPDDATGLI